VSTNLLDRLVVAMLRAADAEHLQVSASAVRRLAEVAALVAATPPPARRGVPPVASTFSEASS